MSTRAPLELAATARPVPILTYHNIGVAPANSTHQGLYLGAEAFRAQLHALRDRGYRGVSMEQALPHLRGEKTGRIAVITFDDGYLDNLQLALPILLESGFSATCYVVAGRIGGYNAWDCETLGVRKPLMTHAQIRQWRDAGMDVGSHTLSHPHLPLLAPSDRDREITDSRDRLQDELGGAIRHFCFPYGEHDGACIEAVARAGYATAVTTQRGRAKRGAKLLALPRLGNNARRSLRRFRMRALLWNLP